MLSREAADLGLNRPFDATPVLLGSADLAVLLKVDQRLELLVW